MKITGKNWKKLVEYIQTNQDLLLALWNGEIGHLDYALQHRKV